MPLKHRLFKQCVLPVMLYGSESWALTWKEESRLTVAQRKMERIMTGTSLLDHRSNASLRKLTGVDDVIISYRRRKWRWVGTIANMADDRWTRRVAKWRPNGRRRRGRQKMRWVDGIVRVAGAGWMEDARGDKLGWLQREHKFALSEK
jgi:hypothetical protein